MLASSRLTHFVKYVLPSIVFVWSLAYLTTTSRDAYSELFRSFRDEKKLFVSDYLTHDIDGDFDGTQIAKLCAVKDWAPPDRALVLTCDPPPGGVGEVKNAHLHCIRFAMEIGAELVLPQIIRRSDADITNLVPSGGPMPKSTPASYFFDVDHLNATLARHCPQMKVHRSMDDLYDVPTLLQPVRFSAMSLTQDFRNMSVIADPQQVRQRFVDFLEAQKPAAKRRYPLRVHLEGSLFTWPTGFDHPGFARNFGRILRVREDARLLAASGLYNLQRRFGLQLDPRRGLRGDSFLGVHLRTEADVAGVFPPYETQAANYLAYMADHQLPVVYLATGATRDNVTAFAARARDFNATVVLKHDVLEGAERGLLDRLSWDQRALVDYEVMLRAGYVVGTTDSIFAWNLALRRHNAYGADGEASKPADRMLNIQWQDRFSTLFGSTLKGQAYELAIWP